MPYIQRLSPPWVAVLAVASLCCSTASPQDPASEPLRLIGLAPAGIRNSVTESWGTLRVELANAGTEGRNARVVAFYPARPDIQYARDIFVPGRSAASSWLPIGPAPEEKSTSSRELEILLYDRTGGQDRLLLPQGRERVRSRGVFYKRREPTTAILLDEPEIDPTTNELRTAASSDEPLLLARCMRDAAGLSEQITVIDERFLPPVPEAFDGIDVLMLATNRLSADPTGLQTLRGWVEQGGTLWVLLDRVNPENVAPLLGEDFDFHTIDRVGVTTVRLHRSNDAAASVPVRDLDEPVGLVRVVTGNRDTHLYTANGQPAAFVRTLGRGRIVFTALGPRGWFRPRTSNDPRARFDFLPDLPIALDALGNLAVLQFHPRMESTRPPSESLRELLLREVGYSVVDRGKAGAIFGALILALIGLGIIVRRSWRPERVGWLGPMAALAAASVFVVLGIQSRGAVPPTIGVAEIVDAVPGSGEAARYGVIAHYGPDSGPALLGTDVDASISLDEAGLEGKVRQRVVTDLGKWHWEGLSLPAGLRTGSFQSTLRAPRLSALARFDSGGVEGRLELDSFRGVGDGLIITPSHELLPIRFGAENTFIASDRDALPSGQYLDAAVMSDRQQRRQAVYRQLLDGRWPRHWEGRNLLLAWADPAEIPIYSGGSVRTVGASLLVLPLEFERPPALQQVTIPRAFIAYSRLFDGRLQIPQLEGSNPVEMRLRFQLPTSVLPLTIERVLLHVKVRTPSRQFIVAGFADGGEVPLYDAENPLDPIRLEIADPRLLGLDPDGGLHLKVQVSGRIGKPATGAGASVPQESKGDVPPPQSKGKSPQPGKKAGAPTSSDRDKQSGPPLTFDTDQPWRIESIGLEVSGRTRADH
jgi:hypothetical protein